RVDVGTAIDEQLHGARDARERREVECAPAALHPRGGELGIALELARHLGGVADAARLEEGQRRFLGEQRLERLVARRRREAFAVVLKQGLEDRLVVAGGGRGDEEDAGEESEEEVALDRHGTTLAIAGEARMCRPARALVRLPAYGERARIRRR